MPIAALNLTFAQALGAHQAGRLVDAEQLYRTILAAEPNHADSLHLLGVVAHQTGRIDLAVELLTKAVGLSPATAVYRSNLGLALKAQGSLDAAIEQYRRALEIQPDLADAHSHLGDALRERGEIDEAIAFCRRALAIRPSHPDALGNLGNAFRDQHKLDEAIACYEAALAIAPGYPEILSNLGLALEGRREISRAIACYEQALSVKPDYLAALSGLGNVLLQRGEPVKAVARYERTISLNPNFSQAHSSLLMAMLYASEYANADIHAKVQRFARQFGRPSETASFSNQREPERRLRIGYVSPDFRAHSVIWFLEPVLRSHDRRMVEIFCYAEVATPDAGTEIIRQFADHWRVTVGRSDETLAAQIRADGIDILVDLAGHTVGNRLTMFAIKPAPIQVSWLGYPATTGLEAIDYRLVDAVTDPPGTADMQASETLFRLNGGFLCYGPALDFPVPKPPPCLTGKPLTFGSFNNPAKLSEATLDVWGSLMRHLPESRLLLKGGPFGDDATRLWYLARLAERGVASDRIEMIAWLPQSAKHLALYDQIDIALDPFPYNGTTTSCEALWMGVPIVTMIGDRHAGRVGASLLHQLGLDELIAETRDEYVAIAARLAAAPHILTELRSGLRARMASSSLCDARGFTARLEAAYREMWRRWCSRDT